MKQFDKKNLDTIMDDYLNSRLSAKEKLAFEEYYFNNDECFSELQFREDLISLIKAKGETLFSAEVQIKKTAKNKLVRFLSKLWPQHWFSEPIWGYSTLAITIGSVAFFVFSIVTQQDRQIDPTRFEILPYLEEIVDDVERSSSLEVVSPKNEMNLKGDVVFAWERIEIPLVYLKLLNNLGEEIYSFTLQKNRFELTEELSPGLYYWKLESEDDLLYIGKFFIKHPN